ncbi:MAG: transketolase [Chitinivibrionales bacterium]|nr:transketolase [Chitinivibrionales bacterium]MBD3355807.1 transketolase [Chitinivibrionales bacterium]
MDTTSKSGTSMSDLFPRYPERIDRKDFYPVAYRYMYLSRTMEERLTELFRKGHVKGTVIISIGGEATTVGMAMPFRPGKDVAGLLHRDFISHILLGSTPFAMMCQYMANAQSPTHGREGNVHHGDAVGRRLPMISHLGNMLAPTVGAVWSARRNGEEVFGLGVIGDGGSSTGDFHESINMASVLDVPILFLIENNCYAFSTPTRYQYNCKNLSDRAAGYGIEGKTVDGTDVWEVYSRVCDALDTMARTSKPYMLECRCLRLEGHAVYDGGEYVSKEERAEWIKLEPLKRARGQLQEVSGYTEERVAALESEIDAEVEDVIEKALSVERPSPHSPPWHVYAPAETFKTPPYRAAKAKNGSAVTAALNYVLQNDAGAVLMGQDIGPYGSAFKTCKGLFATYGRERVIDMPICESATVGMALGATQTGTRPVVEFQFADFGTEAVTQLGLNAATWFFRAGTPAPMVLRLPCGGGITLGAFHSGEYDGLWSRFPGLKLFYPATPQETFEALVAAYYDPNPCLVFEHKLLYWSTDGAIEFDGDVSSVPRPRRYREGDQLTIIATGAMVRESLAAVETQECLAEVWNPYILKPLELGPILDSVKRTGRVLVVQESGYTSGLGNHIIAEIIQQCFGALKCRPRLVSPPDVPVPFARELESHYLPGRKKIGDVIRSMLEAS